MIVPKWVEDVGHVAIGFIPGAGIIREYRQLPPENDRHPVVFFMGLGRAEAEDYWSSSRVLDMMRDLAGYAVGDVVRTSVLVSLLIWRW